MASSPLAVLRLLVLAALAAATVLSVTSPYGAPGERASAAPLAANDNGGNDNGGDSNDNGGGGNDNGGDNGGDNDDNGNGDGNGVIVVTATPTPQPAATSTPTPQPAALPVAPPIPLPGPCQFVLGFAFLHSQLGGIDGDCVTNEFPDPAGTGDQHQFTSRGLMVWEKNTNTMRWTNGAITYTYSQCGLQTRPNTVAFAWERNPSLLQSMPPGTCDVVASSVPGLVNSLWFGAP